MATAQAFGAGVFLNYSENGGLFEASTGLITFAVAGAICGLISNPQSSTKKIQIIKCRIANIATTVPAVTLYEDPTLASPTVVTPWCRTVDGATHTTFATFGYKAGVVSLTGGTPRLQYPIYPSGETDLASDVNPVTIYPGHSVGLQTTNFPISANAACILNWIELAMN